jgi:serine/threonine protein kinase
MQKKPTSLGHEKPEQIPGLENLYDSDWLDPVEGEEEFLYPISKMLAEVPEHYADELFFKAGGEKRIFKVRDLRADRVVALARPVEGASAEQKEEFLREARLTACLQHPNIISIYDIGFDANGEAFFTMEFIHGDTLKDIIEKLDAGDAVYEQRFPLPRLLELFVKLCDAVAYAHSRNVVHLDLKPANIFIGPYGEVVLSDWGLAKIIHSDELVTQRIEYIPQEELPDGDILNDLTLRGVLKGTPGFMAPEQVGKSRQVSRKTDIYSLGALLYFILTHRPAVVGDTTNEVADRTVKGNIVPPSKVSGTQQIPSGLEAVVMKALELEPDARYASAGTFRDELDRYLLGFATQAQHAGWLIKLKLLMKRRRIAFNVGIFFLILLFITVVFSFVKVLREKHLAETAQVEAVENLRLYKQETEHSRKLSDSIRETAMDLINAEDFMHAEGKINAIESHLTQETDPEKIHALTQYLALLHFVVQDFNQASEYFSRIEVRSRYRDCVSLAEKYAQIKPDDSVWLEPDDMCNLLFEIKRHIRAVNYYLAYYYLNNTPKRSANEILPVVETVLDILNYRSFGEIKKDSLQVTQDERGWHLSLRGQPYDIFQLPIAVPLYESNVLKSLQLYSLDVSYSDFYDVERLQGMKLKELNIAGIREIPLHKYYAFKRIGVKRVFHTLELSDKYLAERVPGVEFIRVAD